MIVDKSEKMRKEYGNYLFPANEIQKNILEKGKGSFVWDVDGNKILDLNSG